MAEVSLRKLRKSFGSADIIRNVDIFVPHGSFTVFVGPSGCGKSTLLRVIAGLEDLTDGELEIGGVDVADEPPARRGIAMVFQSYALYPHMTVYQNMAFGLKLGKLSKTEVERRVHHAAKILELDTLLSRLPKHLSGGQRQRVAIGRAITREPKVFLFDEPLSNLDAALRVQMRIEIAKLHKELGATMIYVTHDQVEAMTLADQIVVLNAGRVEQAGPPLELYHRPRNRFVAGFIGSPRMNFLEGVIASTGNGVVRVGLEGGGMIDVPRDTNSVHLGDAVTLGIRPEHLVPRGDGPLTGEVILTEHLGAETHVHVQLAGGQIIVMRQEGAAVRATTQLALAPLSAAYWHLFSADGMALGPAGVVSFERQLRSNA